MYTTILVSHHSNTFEEQDKVLTKREVDYDNIDHKQGGRSAGKLLWLNPESSQKIIGRTCASCLIWREGAHL